LNITVPVAVDGDTVAVIVTLCPMPEGLAEDFRVSVVTGAVIVTLKAVDVLALLLASPPYAAVNECFPIDSAVTASVAVPPLRLPVPSAVEPSLKVTAPVAVLGETVAVSVSVCPKLEDVADDVNFVVVVEVAACSNGPESSTTAART
jgi:hypothetical protein